jgi:hypothetical protein
LVVGAFCAPADVAASATAAIDATMSFMVFPPAVSAEDQLLLFTIVPPVQGYIGAMFP